MASTATVTAKTGPGLQATALTLGDVTQIIFDLARRVLQVVGGSGTNVKEFDLVGVTTVSYSISGANYTITVS